GRNGSGSRCERWSETPRNSGSIFTSVSALFVFNDVLMTTHKRQILDRAAEVRLPVISQYAEIAEAGGLLAYGPNIQVLFVISLVALIPAETGAVLEAARAASLAQDLSILDEHVVPRRPSCAPSRKAFGLLQTVDGTARGLLAVQRFAVHSHSESHAGLGESRLRRYAQPPECRPMPVRSSVTRTHLPL